MSSLKVIVGHLACVTTAMRGTCVVWEEVVFLFFFRQTWCCHVWWTKKRGMMMRGGDYDYERVSVMIMDEYRAGKLGRITLDALPE